MNQRRGRAPRWGLLLLLVLVVVVSTGCGRGYEAANRIIVADLPSLEGVELVEERHYGFCSGDTCLFGNDRNGALLLYTVDTGQYTQETLADAYADALPEWDPSIELGCLNADPDSCEETVFASFIRGEGRIDLNLDNWAVGRFELHVDAKGVG